MGWGGSVQCWLLCARPAAAQCATLQQEKCAAQEAKIMTKLRHPRIVGCHGIGKYEDNDATHPGCLFIVQVCS
jgi:hypothetical protein